MAKISIVVCTDLNGGIGAGNRLLGSFPADLRRFKEITEGGTCVMGRKTYDSIIEKNGHPLPNRDSFVLTSQITRPIPYNGNMTLFINDFESLVGYLSGEGEEVFICGGESVYRQFLPIADKIYSTTIHAVFEGADTFFPYEDLLKEDWTLSSYEYKKDACESGYEMSFREYVRN